MTTRDRITQIRIQNFRCIADLTLDLSGLTVLIGDNGSGKSAIIEAIELIYQAAQAGDFIESLQNHGPPLSLIRQGAHTLALKATIEGAGPRLVYEVAIRLQGQFLVVASEELTAYPENGEPVCYILRERGKVTLNLSHDPPTTSSPPMRGELTLANLRGWPHPMLGRAIEALDRMDVHKPFVVQALWSVFKSGMGQLSSPRLPKTLNPAVRLAHGASNLVDCIQTLRNQGDWDTTLRHIRLGLGDDVKDVRVRLSGPGVGYFEVVFQQLPQPVPCADLSDGQLSYIAFVVLTELSKAQGSVMAFDEPENHLHPQLAARVLWLFKELSEFVPVIVATHSDRLLDALDDPAKSVVLCELDENRAMVIRRPNKEALDLWLKDYRGVGHLRSENLDPFIYDEPLKEPISEPLPSPNASRKTGDA